MAFHHGYSDNRSLAISKKVVILSWNFLCWSTVNHYWFLTRISFIFLSIVFYQNSADCWFISTASIWKLISLSSLLQFPVQVIFNKIFFFFIIQRVKACVIPCPHQPPTMGDNTVLVAQGNTATPGTTKQLLPLDRVLRELYIYIYIYTPDQLRAETTLDVNLHF